MTIRLKRVYDAPSPDDGRRVLVDRLWPRGLTKAKAAADLWLKDVAPSTGLRRWFGHDPGKWTGFEQRYRAEIEDNPALQELRTLALEGDITLLYAAKDEVHNEAVVLKRVLEQRIKQ